MSIMNELTYRKTHPFPYALGMLGITIPGGQMIGAYLVFFL